MSSRLCRRACFVSIFIAVFPVTMILMNSNHTSTSSGLPATNIQLTEFKPQVVKYKDTRWAADIETASYPAINMTAMENEFTERQESLLQRCLHVLSPSEQERPINSKEFLINGKYKLIWCNIFKSASSSWVYNFMLMAGYTDKDMKKQRVSPIEFARKKYERPSVETLSSYLQKEEYVSFIIVRDPFERLLSAYKDKMESQAQTFYKNLRCKIQSNYGDRPITKNKCSPTFPEFVDYLLDEHTKGQTPNEHWAPYYTFCSPCQVKFDYILRFETLDQDEAFLVQMVDGLSSVVTPHKLHSSHTHYEEATQGYFKLLSREQLERLYTIYEKDFEIFNYDAERYFLYIR